MLSLNKIFKSLLDQHQLYYNTFLIIVELIRGNYSGTLLKILLIAAKKSSISTNTIIVEGHEEKKYKFDIFRIFRFLFFHKLQHKNIVIYDRHLPNFTSVDLFKILNLNVYKLDTIHSHRFNQCQHGFRQFFQEVNNAAFSYETSRKFVYISNLNTHWLCEMWETFLKENLNHTIFYELGYLTASFSKEKCFVYLSEHRIEAIDTIRDYYDTGLKESGFRFRNRLVSEKEISYSNQHELYIGKAINLRHCRRRRGFDTYEMPVKVNPYSKIKPNVKIYERSKLKYTDWNKLWASMKTRHRTEFRNAVKAGLSLKIYKPSSEFFSTQQGELYKAVASKYLETTGVDVKLALVIQDSKVVGGIVVVNCLSNPEVYYYVETLAYIEHDKRLSSAQVFAIATFIKNSLETGNTFNFLGSRNKKISSFFAGFGAETSCVLEFHW